MNNRQAYIPNYTEDQTAEFLRLIKQHEKCLMFVLGRYAPRNAFERDDYLQEMYMRAWLNFYKFKNGNSTIDFGNWLITISKDAVFNYYRSRKNNHFRVLIFCREELPEIPEYDDSDYNHDVRALLKAGADLPSDYQQIFNLYIEGFESREIAELLDLSPHSVQMKLYRMKGIIRGKRDVYFGYRERSANNLRSANDDQRMIPRLASKPIYQYTKEGKLLKIWSSLQEIRGNGFDNVDKCVAGEYRECKGYIFSYNELTIEECISRVTIDFSGLYKAVDQLDLEGHLVKRYSSISETKIDGFNPPNVMACIKGRRPTHKGYKWAYADVVKKNENVEHATV